MDIFKIMKSKLPALYSILFFFILSLLLIFAWFKEGYFYGGGDIGLPTYNPQRILEIAKYIWWDAVAPGFLVPHGITSISLYYFLSFIQFLGIGQVGIQAILFFILLFLMGFGMYSLTLSIMGGDKKLYAAVGGLFYMFNPYMMTQIWHRFSHTSMFFVAALPFLIIFWRLWIKNGNFLNLLYFLLINLLASYMFGTIAFVAPLWLILSLFTVSEIFFPWENKSRSLRILVRSFFGLGSWIFFNSWWLIPVTTIGSGIASQQHDIGETIFTLVAISKQAILPFSLQMVNSFYIFSQAELGEVYKSFFFRLIPWLGVVIIFYGLLRALRKKYLAPFAIIFLVVVLLSKGISSPFGHPFLLLFSKFFAFGLLRNPFEKLGILLPLISSILFVIGLEDFFSRAGKIFGQLGSKLILIILFVLMGVYFWPMYQGTIFGKVGQPNYLEIPQSYQDLDEWLSQRVRQDSKIDGKILHLPLIRSDIATYKWRQGYHGIETSASLFRALPSISHGLNLKRIDDSLTALSLIFHKSHPGDPQKILRLIQDFNIRYIVLHKDIEWLGGDLYPPLVIENILNNLDFLKQLQTYDQLLIYKVSDEYFKSKVTIEDDFQIIYPSETGKFWPWLIGGSEIIITPQDNRAEKEIFEKTNQIIIFPQASFINPDISFINSILDQIISNESTAPTVINEIKRFKPILAQNGELEAEKLNDRLISSTEKILAMLKIKKESKILTKVQISSYQNELEDIFAKDLRSSRLLLYIPERDMSLFLQIHLYALMVLKEAADPQNQIYLNQIFEYLKGRLNENNFLPKYPIKLAAEQTVDSQKVFKFQIPKEGEYEILLTNADNLKSLHLSINGKAVDFTAQNQGEVTSLGVYKFSATDWELGYNVITSSNLIQSFDQSIKQGKITHTDGTLRIEPQGQIGFVEIPIPNAKGEDVYKVTFEVLSEGSPGFHFQLAQDIDSINESGQKINQINEFIPLTPNHWQFFGFTLNPLRLTTQQAAIRFVVSSAGQLPPPALLIKNLKIMKVLTGDLILRAKFHESEDTTVGGEALNVDQRSPVLYQGSVNLEKPSFLILSETYHPGWQLKLTNGKDVYYPQKHYMANLYANGWFIDEVGEYKFELEFKPQQKVTLGLYLAIFATLVLLILIVRSKLKRV
jgi:hypothetical protein